MEDTDTVAKLAWELNNLWTLCPRRILSIHENEGYGFALVAPHCIIFSKLLAPCPGGMYDHCLN